MDINNYIDYTLLKPDATQSQIFNLTEEAKKYNFFSVCINPYWVNYCYEQLKENNIKICTVIGFPLGATSTKSKKYETVQAIKDGADEIDMVMNIGELKSHHYNNVVKDISNVVDICHKNKKLIKIIIETCLLNKKEKIEACHIVKQTNADFIKTSTGFSEKGATVEDIKLIKKKLQNNVKIKAAGGIHTLKEAVNMINAGADRIGTSAGVKIINELNR